jgi:hypothetical protein
VETPIISYRKINQDDNICPQSDGECVLGHEGLLLVDFFHKNETINADRCIQTLQKLRQAVRQERVGMLTRGFKLLHDNATPHTAGKLVKN